uniref:BZIP domain-containing protein n=1 Tax=Compsopogon caeruleus TaxID=31354 RepID=A0A7S1T506_9RHOD|mmetsp:Transcript_10165/g.20528  ORF Transcript_10165/g.20528 Transcript_10165/m.20528 type:complete len:262 (+) Transcript_10165:174-959(+)
MDWDPPEDGQGGDRSQRWSRIKEVVDLVPLEFFSASASSNTSVSTANAMRDGLPTSAAMTSTRWIGVATVEPAWLSSPKLLSSPTLRDATPRMSRVLENLTWATPEDVELLDRREKYQENQSESCPEDALLTCYDYVLQGEDRNEVLASARRKFNAGLRLNQKERDIMDLAEFDEFQLKDIHGSTPAAARTMSSSERKLVHVKRRIRNRESARRSREKKKREIGDLSGVDPTREANTRTDHAQRKNLKTEQFGQSDSAKTL